MMLVDSKTQLKQRSPNADLDVTEKEPSVRIFIMVRLRLSKLWNVISHSLIGSL